MSENGNAAENLGNTELAALAQEQDSNVEALPVEKNKSASAASHEQEKDRNLDLILDVPLRVTVELGRTKMVVNELLNLGQGSVVELSKLAGEPMEVFVNDKLVARGEAVVVNEKFGVRLTDIISPSERVEQLA
jgi:flagellar motor switch protein FliN/FliY